MPDPELQRLGLARAYSVPGAWPVFNPPPGWARLVPAAVAQASGVADSPQHAGP